VTERGQQHDGSAKPLLNDSEQGMQVITDWADGFGAASAAGVLL
jgi:hypothetical protein